MLSLRTMVLALLFSTLACGRNAGSASLPADAQADNPDVDRPDAMLSDADAAPTLKVATEPAQAAAVFDPGDENPGATPNGWDFCLAGHLVVAPRAGHSDPPARRGQRYLVHAPPSPGGEGVQAYFYFGTPPPGEAVRGLWLDLAGIGGDPADASLVLYAVDEVCAHPQLLARHALAPVLRAGQWVTACTPLAPGQPGKAMGLRFETRSAEIGLDSVRFGPACPL